MNKNKIAEMLLLKDDECPHKLRKYTDGPDTCEFNTKICLLEGGNECPYWEEIKLEMEGRQ